MKKIIINCIGDSVTEGMAMVGHHSAEYGKDSYPAQLYTMLVDNGYNVKVNNYGHGGEKVAEIGVRCGAFACVTTEELVLPKTYERVSLGKRSVENENGMKTKLKIICEAEEDDREVYFTQMSHDTNPVIIDSNPCIMSVVNDNENVITLANPVGADVVIPKNSLVLTANNKNADINILYGGINDGDKLALKDFIYIMKKCGDVNGGKSLIIGSTKAIWERWNDLEGTKEEKYDKYKRECQKTFGPRFVDLYDEFSRHGMDIALEEGCFRDKTQEELNVMRDKLKNHILPKEFCYDHQTENDVHLSKEGYKVFAKIVFERLKSLNYI